MSLLTTRWRVFPLHILRIFFILHGTAFSLYQQLHLAPMANYTTRHLRYLYRLLTSYPQEDNDKNVVLWSEMIKPRDILTTKSPQMLLSRGKERESGKDCVLQFGGDKAEDLIKSIHVAREYGYTQYNLNCGCPAATNEAPYGAQLMKKAGHVAYLVEKMAEACKYETPISVKCRIGVHETFNDLCEDNYEQFFDFVDTVTKSGTVKNIVVHARSAVLRGLSPAKNRCIPNLRYEFVHQLARDMPSLNVILNGGVFKLTDCMSPKSDNLSGSSSSGGGGSDNFIGKIDGVMLGRSALRKPFEFGTFLDKNRSILSLEDSLSCIDKYIEYIETEMRLCHKGSDISDLILPLALLAYSIERDLDTLVQNEDIGENHSELLARSNHLGWRVVSQTSRLLSVQEESKFRWIQEVASSRAISMSQSNVSDCSHSKGKDVAMPPLKKWRKEVGTHFCGKKIIQKMKSNVVK